jgi:site-specific DNA-cytosine methylase
MDIYGGGNDGQRWYEAIMQEPEYNDKKLLIYNHAAVASHAHCITHDALCPLDTGAYARVGGPPCTDFSLAGDQLGLAGPMLPCLMAYGSKAQSTGTVVATIENVKQMPEWLMLDTLSPKFGCHFFDVQPSMVGYEFINRARSSNCNSCSSAIEWFVS